MALVATQPLQAGQVVLEEAPLLLVRHDDDEAVRGTRADYQYYLNLIRAFNGQTKAVRDKILELHSPTDGPRAVAVRTLLREIVDFSERRDSNKMAGAENETSEQQPDVQGSLLCRSEADFELCVKVAMALLFNGVEVNPAQDDGAGTANTLGVGLYAMACRANHSCQPNCFWYATSDGRRVLRALGGIAAGDELTVDYNLEAMDTKPVHERRARLKAWDFVCECPRCAAYGDDTRSVACCTVSRNASCDGVHLIHQPSAEDEPVLTPCLTCGSRSDAHYAERVLQKETNTAEKLADINATIRAGNFEAPIDSELEDAEAYHGAGLNAIMRLKPPHPSHHLAEEIAWVQYESHKNMAKPQKAAQSLRHVIRCRDAIINVPSRATAFKHEFLGDQLQLFPETTQAQLLEAQEAYRRAIQLLSVTCGPEHPYSACAVRKLVALQARLPADAVALGRDMCSLCGGRVVPAAQEGNELPQCTHCSTAAYCCPEHQSAHWVAHRRVCAAPA